MKKILGIMVLGFILSSCGPRVDVINLSTVEPDVLAKASKLQIFKLDNAQPKPEIDQYIGELTAYSCKHLTWDPPASKGDALKQLKIKAVRAGANGVIDITFDSRGTDTFGTNCWESVQASGTAVVFK
ncbi:YbjQ family protein [Candidatus Pelagibacter sp.]|nr:YbjQ family protein [Candidatus Pelagibacter sp.]|tara:strand:- start:171 stop:554 length:384 start_codon:yes stop_codon:yes gene_type:complete